MGVSTADGLAFLAADKGFISLDRGASAAHGRKFAVPHGLSNAMAEEPCGFHAARQHPLNLVGRNALFAGAHQMDNLQPKMQRKVRAFKDGSLTNGELALALVAFAKAKAGSLAMHELDTRGIGIPAMRANWPIWPQLALDVLESGGFGLKVRGVENGIGHGGISYGLNTTSG